MQFFLLQRNFKEKDAWFATTNDDRTNTSPGTNADFSVQTDTNLLATDFPNQELTFGSSRTRKVEQSIHQKTIPIVNEPAAVSAAKAASSSVLP